MATPAEVVAEQFSNATSYVATNLASMTSFTDALSSAITVAPVIDVTWTPIEAPSSISLPSAPAIDSGEFDWDSTGDIAGSKPDALSVEAPVITIDDFDVDAPELTLPEAPTLDFGTAPVITIGDAPTVPEIAEVEVPDAPSIALPDTPNYLSLSTPSFAGVNLHENLLDTLTDLPTLDLVAPTPYSYSLGAEYASTLLTNLKTMLVSRLSGGTGLNPAVEAAIWDRARSREVQLGAANEAEVTRTHEALGFKLPTGALAAQLRAAQQDTIGKISTLSRDVAIKQAEMEQENLKQTIEQGMALEGKLVDYSYNMERLSFESAKALADNAVQVYNAQVDQYRALLSLYDLYTKAYNTIIDAEKAKIEVYRAELAGEQTKADVNRTLVEQYKATIEAGLSQVRVFEAQVGAAKTRMELEQVKIGAVGEQIRAYVAGINGQTAKVEAYKVGVEAQTARVGAHKVGIDAQLSLVEVFKAQSSAFSAKASAQGDKARAQLAYYSGVVQAKTAEWEGWSARVRGEAARFQALTSKSNAVLDGFKSEVQAVLGKVEQDTRRWAIGIQQYEAQQTYTLNAAKINTDVIQANNRATLEAAKVGAQVFAQLTSSAMSMIHASAGVSASSSNGVSYSYSNDTTDAVAPITTV